MSQNHLTKIAIVGAGGQVGKFMVEELLKSNKNTITAITRSGSNSELPSGIEVKKVNYDDQQSIVEALKGQDVLIVTMAVMAPPGTEHKLIEAAAAAEVPWVFPNEWGLDTTNVPLSQDTMVGVARIKTRELIEQLCKSSWIALCCSFWYEYSLSAGPDTYGFDFQNKAVTFFDEGTTVINTSTWPQTGRTVARLIDLPVKRTHADDKSLCLEDFKNKHVYVSSFAVSQKDMFESVLRVTGDSAKDWKVDHEPSKQRYEDAKKLLMAGDRNAFGRVLYSRVFYPDGSGYYEDKYGLNNDALSLPKEDMDEFTKLAIKSSENGGPLAAMRARAEKQPRKD